MPRGQERQTGVKARRLGSEPVFAGVPARAAIERDVAAFASAWFAGDAPAMTRCLHPDFVNRLMSVGAAPAEGLVQNVVGLQGRFGSKVAPARRKLEVRVLDVRARSASAVAVLGDWVLQVHLAWAGSRWGIVNAMWEMA